MLDRINNMDEIRRANLLKLLNGPRFGGDRKAFCKAADITNGRLSQLLDPNETFGDTAARNLKEKLGLEDGYLEGIDRAKREPDPLADAPERMKAALTTVMGMLTKVPEDQWGNALMAFAELLQKDRRFR